MSKGNPRALADFVRAKKLATCAVCQLPEEIRTQVENAGDKKIKRAEQLAWLNEECGYKITPRDLDRHYAGRHQSP